jgi:hypothetical protein
LTRGEVASLVPLHLLLLLILIPTPMVFVVFRVRVGIVGGEDHERLDDGADLGERLEGGLMQDPRAEGVRQVVAQRFEKRAGDGVRRKEEGEGRRRRRQDQLRQA